MPTFSTFDDKSQRIMDALLKSGGKDWSCVSQECQGQKLVFRLPLPINESGTEDTVYLNLGPKGFQRGEWRLSLGIGATSTRGGVQVPRGRVERDFQTTDPDGDLVTSNWTNMDDPVVAKVREIATNATVTAVGGRTIS